MIAGTRTTSSRRWRRRRTTRRSASLQCRCVVDAVCFVVLYTCRRLKDLSLIAGQSAVWLTHGRRNDGKPGESPSQCQGENIPQLQSSSNCCADRFAHCRGLILRPGSRVSLVSTDLNLAFRGSESMPGDRECGVFPLKHKQPLGSSVWTARRVHRPASLRRASSPKATPAPCLGALRRDN